MRFQRRRRESGRELWADVETGKIHSSLTVSCTPLSSSSAHTMASDAAVTSGLPLDAAAGFRAFAFIAAVGVGAELLLAAWAAGDKAKPESRVAAALDVLRQGVGGGVGGDDAHGGDGDGRGDGRRGEGLGRGNGRRGFLLGQRRRKAAAAAAAAAASSSSSSGAEAARLRSPRRRRLRGRGRGSERRDSRARGGKGDAAAAPATFSFTAAAAVSAATAATPRCLLGALGRGTLRRRGGLCGCRQGPLCRRRGEDGEEFGSSFRFRFCFRAFACSRCSRCCCCCCC